ncbi:MAG: hypothetical protein A2017_05605 [Lentisphaerae bacterium GWF2_44_16]|nr:MAG: hypothetical protein A2017_05605 [Lentisphaerae bacterium GWF2_44_16]
MIKKKSFGFIYRLSGSIALAFFFIFPSACETSYEVMSSAPAKITPFLPDSKRLVDQKASFPFNRLWYEKKLDWERFKKIKIMPVDTTHIMDGNWWQKVNEAKLADMKKDIAYMAKYMRDAFVSALQENPDCKLKVVETADDETLVLHLALIELVPTKAFFNAAGNVAGFFIPGASLVNMLNAGSVAMEAKLIDHKTGAVVAMFTDRETDHAAVINLKDLRWYAHSKAIIDEWAASFAEMASSEDPEEVTRSFPFSFISL